MKAYPIYSCPQCDARAVNTKWEEMVFQYGSDGHPDKAILRCMVPMRQCEACGMRFWDAETEQLREDAVNAHLYSLGKGRSREWSPRWKKQ